MTKNNLFLAVFLLLLATLSWGGMYPVAKASLTVIDPYYMTLIRYAPAALLFLLILFVVEGKAAFAMEGRSLSLLFLGTLGFAGFNLLAFNGLVHAKPEHGAVIMAVMPMITIVMTWLFRGQRPHWFTLLTVIGSFSGVFLVITGGQLLTLVDGGTAEWDLLFLFGAICWVSYTMGAQLFQDWSPLRYTAITCALGTLSIVVITLAMTVSGYSQVPTMDSLVTEQWVIAYLIILGALVAVLSWNAGIKMLGSVNGVLFINFVPVTAFAIGVAQGHQFDNTELMGGVVVITALIANNLFYQRKLKQVG